MIADPHEHTDKLICDVCMSYNENIVSHFKDYGLSFTSLHLPVSIHGNAL